LAADFTHYGENNMPRMVDVGPKKEVGRMAKAEGFIYVGPEVITKLGAMELKKGEPFTAAKLAGIAAAKKTSDLIPLAHPLPLTFADVDFTTDTLNSVIKAFSEVRCFGKTGVEMEALCAVSVALLTIYDMCKAVSKNMRIEGIRLIEKKKDE